MGLDITFVDATDVANVKNGLKVTTKLIFVETIANPATQIADWKPLVTYARKRHHLRG